jgi:hypothetical protein
MHGTKNFLQLAYLLLNAMGLKAKMLVLNRFSFLGDRMDFGCCPRSQSVEAIKLLDDHL